MQGITSRYPIENVAKDIVPTGSGWARIRVGTNVLNIVTVHLNWTPWGHGCKTDVERKASAAKFGGDLARRDETETVLKGSFFTVPDASNQYWVVAGDYNATSRWTRRATQSIGGWPKARPSSISCTNGCRTTSM